VCVPSETEGNESLHNVIGVFFFKGGFIEYKVIQMKGDPKRKSEHIVKRISERIDHIADGKKSESGIVCGIKVEKEMGNGTIGKDSIEETESSKEREGCNDRGPHALCGVQQLSQFFRGAKGAFFGALFGGAKNAFLGTKRAAAAVYYLCNLKLIKILMFYNVLCHSFD
jgi:hypothetical protein